MEQHPDNDLLLPVHNIVCDDFRADCVAVHRLGGAAKYRAVHNNDKLVLCMCCHHAIPDNPGEFSEQRYTIFVFVFRHLYIREVLYLQEADAGD